MLKTGLYFVGKTLATLVAFAAFSLPAVAYIGPPGVQHQFPVLYGVLYLAWPAGVVVHELGHLLACLAVGAEVKAFRLGDKRAPVRFRAGKAQVSLGLPYRGQVEHGGVLSSWRQAVITLAGPLADLAVAGLVLAGSAAVAAGRGSSPLAVTAADGLAWIGLVSLLPYRTGRGRLTDGARLLELRSGVAAARLLAAGQAAGRLLWAGRYAELLELHARLEVPDGRLSAPQAVALNVVDFYVALLPGRLPDDAARLAERRVTALAQRQDLGSAAPQAYVTLALLRLRRGDAHDYAEAERLCERALAEQGADDARRRMALAVVIVSRQARGLPDADVRAAASAVPGHTEAMAAELSATVTPEAALRAIRRGDPGALLGAGTIAALLRRQGRTGELLELHAGFGSPAGTYPLEQARSLHTAEYNVLLVPDLPPAVADEAASRVQWITANYPREQQEDPAGHAALEHTLAVARLRQGRFGEVEPLCAPGLAADLGPDNRATVLATIALARRALGQPHDGLLAEAVALSPNADLVAEARQSRLGDESQPEPFGVT